MKRMKTAAVALAAGAAVAISGCHSGSHAAAKASISAFASSSQGQFDKAQAQAIIGRCLPKSETAQLKLAEPSKGKAARKAVEACLEIPQQNRQAFDDAFVTDTMHGKLGTKAGRATFAETTLPDLVVRYR